MTTMLRRPRKATPTGVRLFSIVLLASVALFGADKKPKAAEPYALIAGTVFRPSGHALAGAKVTIEAEPEAGTTSKFRKQEVASSPRGEFAVRVPAAPMRYRVTVKASGNRTESKPVTIEGDERVDLSFALEAEK